MSGDKTLSQLRKTLFVGFPPVSRVLFSCLVSSAPEPAVYLPRNLPQLVLRPNIRQHANSVSRSDLLTSAPTALVESHRLPARP